MFKSFLSVLAIMALSSSIHAAEDRNVGTAKLQGWNGALAIINIYGGAAKSLFDDLKLPIINDDLSNLSYQKRKGPGVYCEKRIDRMKSSETKDEHDIEVSYSCTVRIDLLTGKTLDIIY